MSSEATPLPADEVIADLVRRLWTADTGAWREGDLTSLAELPAARLRPVAPDERHWFGTEDHAALHIPLTAPAGPGAKADAFRHTAEVVTGVLGPAALLGCWGDQAPFSTAPPAWGSPFRRWHRPDGPNSLELSAGEDGPELVLQPKAPSEHWLEKLGEAPRPITAFLAYSPNDPANDGLGLPGYARTEDWDEFADSLGAFLAPLPAATRALDVELSLALHAAIPGTFGPVTFHLACGTQLELALYPRSGRPRDEELAALGWIQESALASSCDHWHAGEGPVSHHSEAHGAGAAGASALSRLLVDTAKAFGIEAPTGLNLHASADDLGGYRTRYYALPHGGYRSTHDDATPPPAVPVTDADEQLALAAQAYEAEKDEVAARALTRAAGAGSQQRALEAASSYAEARAAMGHRPGAFRYAEVTLEAPAETGPPELRAADRLRSTGESTRARHRYEQLTDHPSFAVRLLARKRLLAAAREAGDEPAAQALLHGRLADIRWAGDGPEALGLFRAAARTGVPVAEFELGERLLRAGEIDEARSVFHRVTDLDTGLVCRALSRIGESYNRRDEGDEAHAWYRRALEAPGEPDTAALAGITCLLGGRAKAAGDLPEARRRYQAVLDLGDPGQRPLAAAHLAEMAYWLGEYDTAARFYEFTLATGTRDAELVGEACCRLAEIRREAGETDLARRCLLRAADSGHPEFARRARALLDDLRRSGGR
ncbi:tetratricopeptide repeat protein [Streptomyces sp. 3N207]|uniref:tetratricopeptide repeat protein n=1 Tax=Streptomyces sp. 3N207 TaxID=3457417 RepID=UPI003FD18CD2